MSNTEMSASPPKATSRQAHAATELFPMMSDDEFAALKADIEQHGQREPAVYYKGQVLDGRNRARACEELGIELSQRELDEDQDPVAFVLSVNLHRRHLTPSQRAAIAAEILPTIEAEAKKRQRAAGGDRKSEAAKKSVPQKVAEPKSGESRDQAARAVGVNRQYVSDAKTIKESDPETFQKLRSGAVTLAQAKRKVSAMKTSTSTSKRKPTKATNPKLTAPGLKAALAALDRLSTTLDSIGLLDDFEAELSRIRLRLNDAAAVDVKQKKKSAEAIGGEVKPPKRATKTRTAGRSKVAGKQKQTAAAK